jgi:hypothetical protein
LTIFENLPFLSCLNPRSERDDNAQSLLCLPKYLFGTRPVS